MVLFNAGKSWTYRVAASDISAVMDLKHDGQICLHHTCLVNAPKHAIVWTCPAGHRKVNWYCPEHGQEMMRMLMSGQNYGICCEECPPHALMKPLTEGR